MARYGGGRLTVGAARGVDVRQLARWGAFHGLQDRGLLGGWGRYTATPEGLWVRYGLAGDTEERAAWVAVEWTPCPFGGRRPWFLCPRCGRRCQAVYVRSGVACRKCSGLAYHSQRLNASDRAHRRGMRLVERLGVPRGEPSHWASLEPWTVEKPPRMRWATYERIVERAREAEEDRFLALMPGLERFLARAERLAGKLKG